MMTHVTETYRKSIWKHGANGDLANNLRKHCIYGIVLHVLVYVKYTA
jgi:hypothetical protein